ncbi:redoxin domain-containing protein [Lentisphaerota bacterium ZTH]|nr:redoxin domain-containing protein [Lentisphaerota bacterium]WET07682.1 redoxin domain-containing protein [Lentisphaerota bacterium ZTH]
MNTRKLLAAAITVFTASACFSLTVGDKAPELRIKKWVKGKPVKITAGKGKKVFVIEFWATWCKPCKMSIPHLNILQRKYKKQGLVIAGISTETPEVISKYLKGQGLADYSFGADDKMKTSGAYMKGVSGIPAAFIIGKSGRVVWIGHPLEVEPVLKRIFAGKFDMHKEQHERRENKKLKAAFAKRDYQAALQLTDERLQENPGDPKYVSLKAFILFSMGRAAESLKYVNKMIEAYPENLKLLKVKVFILKKLNMNKELDLCYAECIDKYSNPLELNSLAWDLISRKFGTAKLKLALRAACKAYEAEKYLNPADKAVVGNTLARVYYLVGRPDKAVAVQKEACFIFKKYKSQEYRRAQLNLKYYLEAYSIGQTIK